MIAWTEGITDLHRRVMRKIVTNVKEYQFQNQRMGKSKEQAKQRMRNDVDQVDKNPPQTYHKSAKCENSNHGRKS